MDAIVDRQMFSRSVNWVPDPLRDAYGGQRMAGERMEFEAFIPFGITSGRSDGPCEYACGKCLLCTDFDSGRRERRAGECEYRDAI